MLQELERADARPADQAENLVERAAARKLSPVHVQRHDDATDGWALATGGYAA